MGFSRGRSTSALPDVHELTHEPPYVVEGERRVSVAGKIRGHRDFVLGGNFEIPGGGIWLTGAKGAAMPGYTNDKQQVQARLRRIEGQVRGLQRMVDEDVYCIDVLTQISAATKALQSVALGLLDGHIQHCVTEAITTGGPDAEAKIKEATAAIERLVRS